MTTTHNETERAELKPLRCISGANGSSDYCGFCGADMCFIPPVCPERVRRALKEIPEADVQVYGCSWEASYPQEPDSRCEKWCGRPECPVTLTPGSKHHILGVTTDKKAAALLSSDAKPVQDGERAELIERLNALADLCGMATGGWDLPDSATARISIIASKAAALLAADKVDRDPLGDFALVPLKLTREMEAYLMEEDWDWPELLAIAGTVSEEKCDRALDLEAADKPAESGGEPYPNAAAVVRMVHDFPALSAFHHKHALGPMLAPSCLCCGQLPEEVAIKHMELPGIVICKKCHDAALYTKPQADALRVPDGYVLVPIEPTSDMLAALSCEWHSSRHHPERYRAMLSAAPQPQDSKEPTNFQPTGEMK